MNVSADKSYHNLELVAAAAAGTVALTWGSIAFLGSAWSIGSNYPMVTLFSTIGLAALAGKGCHDFLTGNKKQISLNASEYLNKKYGHEAKNISLKIKKHVDGLYNNTGLESCSRESYSSLIIKLIEAKNMNPLDAWVMMLTDKSMRRQLFEMKNNERVNLTHFIDSFSKHLEQYQQSTPIAKQEFNEIIDVLINSGFSFPNVPILSDYTLKQPMSAKSWTRLLTETLVNRPKAVTYQFRIAEEDSQSLKDIMWKVIKENVFRGPQNLEG